MRHPGMVECVTVVMAFISLFYCCNGNRKQGITEQRSDDDKSHNVGENASL